MKALFACLLISIFGIFGISASLHYGKELTTAHTPIPSSNVTPVGAGHLPPRTRRIGLSSDQRIFTPSPIYFLFLQIVIVLSAARFCGNIAIKLHQPEVIGEMIAGILLGPSLLGLLSPKLFSFVFTPSSLSSLNVLSQTGISIFMFVVGMELSPSSFKSLAKTAVLIGEVGILVPYLFGTISALFLFPILKPVGVGFPVFAMFIGISLSITAFPVLARILQERRLIETKLGATALACAAASDAGAWCLFAFVAAIAGSQTASSATTAIVLLVIFLIVMLYAVRPALSRQFGRRYSQDNVLSTAFIILFLSALITDIIGIHALFGCFIAGLVMPDSVDLRNFIRLRVESVSTVLLLPIFFAFTGLRMQVGTLTAIDYVVCVCLILVATIGKLGGVMIAARLNGIQWADAFTLGALMNTRGLIELIALNIGYDLGILSPEMFSILIIVALVTTCMTGPLVHIGVHIERPHTSLARLT